MVCVAYNALSINYTNGFISREHYLKRVEPYASKEHISLIETVNSIVLHKYTCGIRMRRKSNMLVFLNTILDCLLHKKLYMHPALQNTLISNSIKQLHEN